jgi:hypothetical protein
MGRPPLRDTLLELRCRREDVGCVAPCRGAPECAALPLGSVTSSSTLEATLEVVEATEAEWARKADSSRVSRLTTASCSFSSSRCISAAVMGRGCRMGTLPASALGRFGLRGGKAWVCWDADGGSVPPGEARGSGGGLMGYICEARREAGVEFWRELDVPVCECDGLLVTLGRGDTGTEFKSGAILSV